MKDRLTSFDVAAVARELEDVVAGARFQKTYQVDDEELRIRLYTGERRDLVVSPRRVHLTQYPKPAPQRASNFAMAVRSRTQGGFVRSVRQHEFDRVLIIEVETEESRSEIVVEMFGDGNVAVVEDGVTQVSMTSRSYRDRKVVPGEEYGFPPAQVDPSEMEIEELEGILKDSDTDLVRTLATELSLGGLYAEEVASRAGLDKHLEAAEMGPGEVEEVFDALQGLFGELEEGGEPQVIYDGEGEPVDAVPLSLEGYEGREREFFDSFNEALDAYFSSMEIEEVGDAEEAWKEDLEALESRLQHQRSAIDGFEEKAERMQELGDLLYAHYGEVSEVLDAVERARENDYSWGEIEETLGGESDVFRGVKGEGPEVVLEIEGEDVELDFRKEVPALAEEMYEAGKKAEEKKEGAKRAIKDTEREIEELKEQGFQVEESVPQRRIRRPEHWYLKYRWFETSDGFLVVAGRSADQNEELVKSHLEKGDLFVHTDVEGAPVTVVKEGQGAPASSVEEAAVFALSNSAIWKRGFFSGDVYAVEPDQVSKTPESGEHLPKGSFVIRGERNYFNNLGVSHCVGLTVEGETRVIGGPCSAVGEQSRYWVELEPGDVDRYEVAEEVRDRFREGCDDRDRRVVEEVATKDAVAQVLPPGESRVVGDWRE